MITLYSTHCPKCAVLEKKLEQANIAFTVNDDLDLMTSKGIKSAPTIEKDGELLDFSKAIAWLRSL